MVDDLQPGLHVVDAGEAAQVLEVEPRVVLGGAQDSRDIPAVDGQDDVQRALGGLKRHVGENRDEEVGDAAGRRRDDGRFLQLLWAHPILLRSSMILF